MSAMPTAVQLLGTALTLIGLFSKVMEIRGRPEAVFFSGLNYAAVAAGLCLVVLGLAYQFLVFRETDAGNKPSSNSSP